MTLLRKIVLLAKSLSPDHRRVRRRLQEITARANAEEMAKRPWWHGTDVPLCTKCRRPITEHWDFPQVCARFRQA